MTSSTPVSATPRSRNAWLAASNMRRLVACLWVGGYRIGALHDERHTIAQAPTPNCSSWVGAPRRSFACSMSLVGAARPLGRHLSILSGKADTCALTFRLARPFLSPLFRPPRTAHAAASRLLAHGIHRSPALSRGDEAALHGAAGAR